jgi:hypothetical protein
MKDSMTRRSASACAVLVALVAGTVGLTANGAYAWLHDGQETAYPSSGGTWQYGFWNAKVRSYYTVSKCHGSSVKLNSDLVRSIDTASGKKSIAEKSALNLPGNDDAYYYRTC